MMWTPRALRSTHTNIYIFFLKKRYRYTHFSKFQNPICEDRCFSEVRDFRLVEEDVMYDVITSSLLKNFLTYFLFFSFFFFFSGDDWRSRLLTLDSMLYLENGGLRYPYLTLGIYMYVSHRMRVRILFIPFNHSFWSFTTIFSGSFRWTIEKCERLLLRVIHSFLRLLLYEMMTTIMTISYYTTSPRTNTFKTTKFNVLEIHF